MILPSAAVLTTGITAVVEIKVAHITCNSSYWHGKGRQSKWLPRDLAFPFIAFEAIT
jgi:hypothetical protein